MQIPGNFRAEGGCLRFVIADRSRLFGAPLGIDRALEEETSAVRKEVASKDNRRLNSMVAVLRSSAQ